MSTKKSIFPLAIIVALVCLSIMPGCKKYSDPPPFFEKNEDTVLLVKRKILVIGIDGAVGKEYKELKPATFMDMKKHAKYSWEAVSDESTTDASSWKTLMSGVSFFRHGIKDSSMVYTQPSGGSEHAQIISYPSFLNYLLTTTKADTKVAFITSWPELLLRLVPEVETKVPVANDAIVKDSAVSIVKNPKSEVVFVQFNGVAKAGLQDGFSAQSAGYKAAVDKVDGYIGEIMAALKTRPEYNKKEEWLVVVTGTHGGKNKAYGGSSSEETNVPALYYNEKFKEKEFVTAGAFSGVEIKGQNAGAVKAQLLNDGGLYNSKRGEQTVQVKVRGTSGSYPHFFSTMATWPGTPGWSMFTSGSEWSVSIRSTTSGELRLQNNRRAILDGQWHTLTFSIVDSAGKMYGRKYTDGIRHDQADISSLYTNGGTVESPSPMTLGWGADKGMGSSTFFTADAMVFNTGLTDEEIKSSICMMDISKHPKYSNLIGYWPANDGFGGRFKNKAPGQTTDFVLSGPYQWTGVESLPCTTTKLTDPTKESLLVKAVDLAPIFFYWLRLTPKADWGLEGTNWLNKYEIEFVGI